MNDTRSGLQVFPEYYTKGPHTPKMEMDYSDEEVPSGRASPAPREIHVSARKVVSPRKALGPSTAQTPQSTAEKSSHYGHECTSLSPMSSSGRVLNKSIDVLALEEQLQQCTRQMEVDHETIEALGSKLAEAEFAAQQEQRRLSSELNRRSREVEQADESAQKAASERDYFRGRLLRATISAR